MSSSQPDLALFAAGQCVLPRNREMSLGPVHGDRRAGFDCCRDGVEGSTGRLRPEFGAYSGDRLDWHALVRHEAGFDSSSGRGDGESNHRILLSTCDLEGTRRDGTRLESQRRPGPGTSSCPGAVSSPRRYQSPADAAWSAAYARACSCPGLRARRPAASGMAHGSRGDGGRALAATECLPLAERLRIAAGGHDGRVE